jgi:hypothetical protein
MECSKNLQICEWKNNTSKVKNKNEDENILDDKEENGKIFLTPALLASL